MSDDWGYYERYGHTPDPQETENVMSSHTCPVCNREESVEINVSWERQGDGYMIGMVESAEVISQTCECEFTDDQWQGLVDAARIDDDSSGDYEDDGLEVADWQDEPILR